MKAEVILGLSFGDEGKGIATDYFSQQHKDSLIFRFNGGQQAGHGVVDSNGHRHVFANFGSGSLRGVPTYWTKYCTFHPDGFCNERRLLSKAGHNPKVYLDALAMVTTPFDIMYNRALELSRDRHGSCGVGFGTTIERNATPYKLHAQDLLLTTDMLTRKLNAVHHYYTQKINNSGVQSIVDYWKQYDWAVTIKNYLAVIDEIKGCFEVVSESVFMPLVEKKYSALVFEGAQGIWLDMDFGLFPNVTRSNCTSKNAIELWNKYFTSPDDEMNINYITRAYLTRHGAGYLPYENFKQFSVKPNPKESNVYDDWQQAFRKAPLNFDMINAAIQFDKNFSGAGAVHGHVRRHLVVTCLDQLEGNALAVADDKVQWDIDSMEKFMGFVKHRISNLYLSHSDCSDGITCHKIGDGIKGIGLQKTENQFA